MATTPQCKICGATINLYTVTVGAQTNYACTKHIGSVAEIEMAQVGTKEIVVARVKSR